MGYSPSTRARTLEAVSGDMTLTSRVAGTCGGWGRMVDFLLCTAVVLPQSLKTSATYLLNLLNVGNFFIFAIIYHNHTFIIV